MQGNKKIKESNPITCRIVEDLWPNDNQKNDDCKFLWNITLTDDVNKRMLWETWTDNSVYETYLSGNKNIFVHPLQIKQVIHDVLSIMTGKPDVPLENQATARARKGKTYRCEMFLGDQRHKGKEEKTSRINTEEHSELFWKAVVQERNLVTNHTVQAKAKQEKFEKLFFQILKPGAGDYGMGYNKEKEKTYDIEHGEYEYHGNGWFKNICWNDNLKHHPQINNDALKNWALATTWQYLELDVKQDSVSYPGKKIE